MAGGLFDDEDRIDGVLETLIDQANNPPVLGTSTEARQRIASAERVDARRRGRSRLEVQAGKVVRVAHAAPRPSVVVLDGNVSAVLESVKVTLLRVRNHVKPDGGGLPEWLIVECMEQITAIDRALAPRDSDDA